ncbi:MAG TPA: hypothetical protein VFM88_06655 [Vicinamibacteria bacterium]|nr:hypothetical protein [Vicinamibacteria bacterium]
MKQIIVELPEATLAELERVAPGRARQRSAFIRAALRRALDAEEERRMAEAYRRQPDGMEPAYFEAAAWEAPRGRRRPTRKRA